MSDPPLIYVIVLSWNGKDDTMGCLSSLESAVSDRVRVLVVDNASTDGTYEAVRENFPWAEILRNEENLGFPGGNNVGIRYALEEGAEYVVLLNNDTVVDREFVAALLEAAKTDPRAGFLSSKIYYFDPPDVLWFAGGKFSVATGRSLHIGYGEKDTGQYDEIREIERSCGCSMMVTRRLLEEVGLMEEKLFLYGEEVEWMLRALKKGFRALFVPGSKVWHKVSVKSEGERSGRSYYYAARNTLYILKTNAPYRFFLFNWTRALVVVILFFLSIFRLNMLKWPSIRSIAIGAFDYVRGNMGKRKKSRKIHV
jgi:GT2 family glycosyltransferase